MIIQKKCLSKEIESSIFVKPGTHRECIHIIKGNPVNMQNFSQYTKTKIPVRKLEEYKEHYPHKLNEYVIALKIITFYLKIQSFLK